MLHKWPFERHLGRKNIWIALGIAALYTLLTPALPLPWRCNVFLGPLVIALYSHSALSCLWLAATCGFGIDLLAAPYPMGLYATTYLAAQAILWRCKNYFFADVPSTLPILVIISSLLTTLFLSLLLLLNGQIPLPSMLFLAIDGILLAASDAALASLLFIVPAYYFKR